MKRVVYGDKLNQVRGLQALALQATQALDDVLGPSAALVDAEWDLTEDENGRGLLVLRISDGTGSASAALAPSELEQRGPLRARFYRLWGDLLQARSHKQLEELRQTSSAGEG